MTFREHQRQTRTEPGTLHLCKNIEPLMQQMREHS